MRMRGMRDEFRQKQKQKLSSGRRQVGRKGDACTTLRSASATTMSRASEGDKIDESQPPLLAKVLVQRLSDPVEEAQRTIARVAEAWKQVSPT